MNVRVLLVVLLAFGMTPVAAAPLTPQDSTAPAAPASVAAAAPSDDDGNYTRLYVDGTGSHLELKPGESAEFEVTVKNAEDRAVDIDPQLYVPPVGENLLKESWVSVDGPTSVPAGGEVTLTVSVSVPDDAQLGRYHGSVAVTNETIRYPGRPPRPVHAQGVSVRVWKQPTVEVLSRTYVHAQVEAGDAVTQQVVVRNNGDEAVPLSPELGRERRVHHHGNGPGVVKPAWVDVDAPSEIAPGETATVTITVSPPEGADRGRYRGEVDLGLKDPARPEHSTHWQRVNLNVEVWKQPSKAFETTFAVSEDATNVTLALTPRSAQYGPATSGHADPVGFDVEFVAPDGTTVDAERVEVTDRGFVDLGANGRAATSGDYAVQNTGQRFVYRVDDPAAGTWTLRVTPKNTMGFGYEIVRDESASDE